MKKTITKEVEICERCGNEITPVYLKYNCPVCKRLVCSHCKFGVMIKYPDLCVDCIKLTEIQKRREKFEERYWKQYHKEEEELKKLDLQKG